MDKKWQYGGLVDNKKCHPLMEVKQVQDLSREDSDNSLTTKYKDKKLFFYQRDLNLIYTTILAR